jgi:shikimate dehydrogenase
MNIDGTTQLIGIIANPIGHVRTPQLFNATASKQGLNVVCVPCHVPEDRVEAFLAGAAAARNFLGLIVTIPHKERVVDLCGDLTDAARLVGSVNAMRYDRGRQLWVGGNFDGDGFVAGLRERGHSLQGKRVLLVGAGGAGKSIGYAVGRANPAELVLHNRSEQRASEVVARLNRGVPNVVIRSGPADATCFDVVINATSLGLKDDDSLPLSADTLAPGTLVCEAVMRDVDTPLIRAARTRDCTIHHGHHMLYGQIVQMANFLGVPLEAQYVERTLGPRD